MGGRPALGAAPPTGPLIARSVPLLSGGTSRRRRELNPAPPTRAPTPASSSKVSPQSAAVMPTPVAPRSRAGAAKRSRRAIPQASHWRCRPPKTTAPFDFLDPTAPTTGHQQCPEPQSRLSASSRAPEGLGLYGGEDTGTLGHPSKPNRNPPSLSSRRPAAGAHLLDHELARSALTPRREAPVHDHDHVPARRRRRSPLQGFTLPGQGAPRGCTYRRMAACCKSRRALAAPVRCQTTNRTTGLGEGTPRPVGDKTTGRREGNTLRPVEE